MFGIRAIRWNWAAKSRQSRRAHILQPRNSGQPASTMICRCRRRCCCCWSRLYRCYCCCTTSNWNIYINVYACLCLCVCFVGFLIRLHEEHFFLFSSCCFLCTAQTLTFISIKKDVGWRFNILFLILPFIRESYTPSHRRNIFIASVSSLFLFFFFEYLFFTYTHKTFKFVCAVPLCYYFDILIKKEPFAISIIIRVVWVIHASWSSVIKTNQVIFLPKLERKFFIYLTQIIQFNQSNF